MAHDHMTHQLRSGTRIRTEVVVIEGTRYVCIWEAGENSIYIKLTDFEDFTRAMQVQNGQLPG